MFSDAVEPLVKYLSLKFYNLTGAEKRIGTVLGGQF